MPNPAIDSSKLAALRAQQEYQRQLDLYHIEEEKRIQKMQKFRKQAIILPLVTLPLLAFFVFVPRMIEFSFVWVPIFTFLGVTEILLIFGFLVSSRPSFAPKSPNGIEAKESNL
jgi:hypothetical protein